LATSRRKRDKAANLAELVEASSWYHTIELPGGIVTKGAYDHRPLVQHMGFPENLTGQRALDVATFDGFWAFELERRGADVVAVDVEDAIGYDWPTGVREIVENEHLGVDVGASFEVARAALGSKVRRVPCSVYRLDPDELGKFDLVFAGDLLLHLERPLEALRRIRSVTSAKLVLADRYDPSISRRGSRLIRYEGGWQGLEWWAPSLETLAQWVIDAGFEDVEVKCVYQLATRFSDPAGWHRAVIHASAY
jgi:tRNA (mo5U34)-methyltransferase